MLDLLPAHGADRAGLLDDLRLQPAHRRARTTTARRSATGGGRCSTCDPDVDAATGAPLIYQLHAIIAWAFWALFPFSRLVHAWSIPLQYLGRPYILYRRRYATTPDAPATSAARRRDAAPAAALALATLAFTSASTPGACSGRWGPTCRTTSGLSDFELSAMVAVPVLLGSLLRIPLGVLTDRHGGRRVFTALMAFTPLPLVGAGAWHDSLARDARLRLPARLRRRVVRRRRAVRQRAGTRRSARASRSASTAWAWAAPCSPASPRRGSPTPGASPPPFWVAAGARRGGRPSSSPCGAATRRGAARPAARHRSPRSPPFRGSGRRAGRSRSSTSCLRRLRRDVPLPAEAADRRPRPHKADAGARAAGFALLAVIGPARSAAGSSDRIGADARAARLVHRDRRARARARRRATATWCR